MRYDLSTRIEHDQLAFVLPAAAVAPAAVAAAVAVALVAAAAPLAAFPAAWTAMAVGRKSEYVRMMADQKLFRVNNANPL